MALCYPSRNHKPLSTNASEPPSSKGLSIANGLVVDKIANESD